MGGHEVRQCRNRIAVVGGTPAAEGGVPVGQRVTRIGGAQKIPDGGEVEQGTPLGRWRREQRFGQIGPVGDGAGEPIVERRLGGELGLRRAPEACGDRVGGR